MSIVTGALVSLGGSGRYLHWGFIQISVANFVVICLMVAVFVAALFVPFRLRRHGLRRTPPPTAQTERVHEDGGAPT
jgi:hypothetical protein